jgi:hypothetical protein
MSDEPAWEKTQVLKNATGDVIRVIHQPGNGTRYDLTACRQVYEKGFNAHEWVCAFPTFGCTYLIREDSDPSIEYMTEKFRGRVKLQPVDYSEMIKAIAAAVPGVGTAFCITDSTGHVTANGETRYLTPEGREKLRDEQAAIHID